MPSRNASSHASPKTSNHSTQLSLELQLLKNLCGTGLASLPRDELDTLKHHSWAAPDNKIIFDALLRLANISPAALPHQLPAEATRMGFPDVAWDKYLPRDENAPVTGKNECHPSSTELIAALRTLRTSTAANQSPARSK